MTVLKSHQEDLMSRVKLLQTLVSECDMIDDPCPLLDTQLNDLSVLTSKLEGAIRQLQESLK